MQELEPENGLKMETNEQVSSVGPIDVDVEVDQPSSPNDQNMDLVMQIPVSVEVLLGSARMPVSRLMKLGRGSVVALDRKVGDPIDLVVNGRVIARGEVVLLEDGSSRFGISLTEIVSGGSAHVEGRDNEA